MSPCPRGGRRRPLSPAWRRVPQPPLPHGSVFLSQHCLPPCPPEPPSPRGTFSLSHHCLAPCPSAVITPQLHVTQPPSPLIAQHCLVPCPLAAIVPWLLVPQLLWPYTFFSCRSLVALSASVAVVRQLLVPQQQSPSGSLSLGRCYLAAPSLTLLPVSFPLSCHCLVALCPSTAITQAHKKSLVLKRRRRSW